MAIRDTVQFEGLTELIRGLNVRADLDDVKHVVRVNGAELQKKAKRNAPNKTGTLERSINLRIIERGYTARVATNVHYAGYQEFGTRYFVGKWYMWRAFYAQRNKFRSDMKRLMRG